MIASVNYAFHLFVGLFVRREKGKKCREVVGSCCLKLPELRLQIQSVVVVAGSATGVQRYLCVIPVDFDFVGGRLICV